MISVTEAQQLIEQHVNCLSDEAVSLGCAQGRVLREPVAAVEDLPAFDRSAMDGYAVRRVDDTDEFSVVGEIRAGQSVDRELEPGQAMRIFTGARLPGPGLKVVLQEHVELREQKIRLLQQSPATHVRLRGEDARAGETLLASGIMLDATAVALLASIGKTSIRVAKRPRILHLTTGDEIVPPEQIPSPGQIRNGNASLVAGLCREQGLETFHHVHAPDNLTALIETLSQARVEIYDMVLISGGSGSGDYDYTTEIFRHLGTVIHFREVNVRPGKPLIFGTCASQVVFGLPGNALSHFVCFHLFVRRALDRLLYRQGSTVLPGMMAETMSETANARETWWPAKVNLNQGRLECRALPWKSSGDITRLPAANALVKVPASTPQLAAGTMVELLITRSLF